MVLEKCPHCGGLAQLKVNFNTSIGCYFAVVKCLVCGATGKTCSQYDEPQSEEDPALAGAVEAWNMRTK